MDVLTDMTEFAQRAHAARSIRFDPPSAMRHAPAAVVISASCVAALWMATQLLRRDDALGIPAYDQAFFQQVVWNVDHGRGFIDRKSVV